LVLVADSSVTRALAAKPVPGPIGVDDAHASGYRSESHCATCDPLRLDRPVRMRTIPRTSGFDEKWLVTGRVVTHQLPGPHSSPVRLSPVMRRVVAGHSLGGYRSRVGWSPITTTSPMMLSATISIKLDNSRMEIDHDWDLILANRADRRDFPKSNSGRSNVMMPVMLIMLNSASSLYDRCQEAGHRTH